MEFAVYSSVALFEPAWIPGYVEVKKIMAMGLKIDALARGISGCQNPYRLFVWRQVESAFDRFPFVGRRRPMVNLDALLIQMSSSYCCSQHSDQIPQRVFVLGENKKP